MIKFDIEIQREIISAGLDDFTPNAILPKMHGGQYGETPEEWRKEVVLFIFSMLATGLITPLPGIEGYQSRSSEEIRDILLLGDSKNGLDVDLVWDVIHFSGTQKLLELLSMFQLNTWESMHSELSLSLGKDLAEMNVVCI